MKSDLNEFDGNFTVKELLELLNKYPLNTEVLGIKMCIAKDFMEIMPTDPEFYEEVLHYMTRKKTNDGFVQ